MKDIKTELQVWAQKTVGKYIEIATDKDKKYDLGFYQQSPLTEIAAPVEVVVMGINPGSGGSYTEQKQDKEKIWKLNGHDATATNLLNGNPCWNEHNNWTFWKNVTKLLCPAFEDLSDESKKIVLTNATFFNTPNTGTLPNNVIQKTIGFTIDLINILSPTSKIVVVLSGANCFKLLKIHYKNEFQGESVFDNKLIIGRLKGITYIGIYHPASRYTSVLTKLIQKSICIIKENIDLELTKLKDLLQDKCANEWENVKNYVPTKSNNLQYALELKPLLEQRYAIEKPQNDKIQIPINDQIEAVFVAQSGAQHIYWRHIGYNGKIHYNNPLATYSHAAEIMELLKRNNYTENKEQTSLGIRELNTFSIMDDIETTAAKIIEEIEFIKKEISKIFNY